MDLRRFGLAVDWRRSFITTDRNKYYDAFVRWQFRTLRKRGFINFGLRPAVFSTLSQQPCADHDRASGEGVTPQEYTLVKMRLNTVLPSWLEAAPELEGRSLFLVAATLRPETVYGQTNCFILPDGDYSFYLAFNKQVSTINRGSGALQERLSRAEALERTRAVYICSDRSAENMCYQGLIPTEEASLLGCRGISVYRVKGAELIGLPLTSPYAVYDPIYVLPMMTISMEKGTGVVMSVPSDAPDDYAALRDLQEKEALRLKYKVTEAMVNIDVVEIIDIPGFGKRAAVDVCISNKIKSQNDKLLLAAAKEQIYKKGFYEGVMVVGKYKDMKVCDAKLKVREDLIKECDAVSYFEPEKKVVSRSGDSCIVALCEQWYLDYGISQWKDRVLKHIQDPSQFSAYSDTCLRQFEIVVGWLREWACSRQYGLGTFLPWDKEQKILIESLSDSTVYMAYYTIAHFLQADINGDVPGLLGITPDQLSDEVFDYIFELSPTIPSETKISLEKLEIMKKEFQYWYPLDLRVSGKDLIYNHLSMSLFNHAAIWDNDSSKWPRSFACNGHVLVDGEKMSKSAGNFLTLEDSIREYTSDGTRVALADAGDSLDDANFQKDVAQAALMKLFILEQFIGERIKESLALRKGEKNWNDLTFENEIVRLVNAAEIAYEKMLFRDALKASFYDYSTARDLYRNLCGDAGMHAESLDLWIQTGAIILSPIAPHISEHIWSTQLKQTGLVIDQPWPQLKPFDPLLHRQLNTLYDSLEDFRKVKEKTVKGKAVISQSSKAIIYVAKNYSTWQESVLKLLEKSMNENPIATKECAFVSSIRQMDIFKSEKKLLQEAISFAIFKIKEDYRVRGSAALELQLPFDEQALLNDNLSFLIRALGVKSVEIFPSSSAHPQDTTNRYRAAAPSRPVIVFL